MRKRAERKPRSLLGWLWRWHTRFCPGWRSFQQKIARGEVKRDVQIHGKTFHVRRAPLEQIMPLRHDVIIVGTQRPSDDFDGDRNPTTRHYGVFSDGGCVGCASLMLSTLDGASAWQLRGMAVAEDHAGQGVGRELCAFIEDDIRQTSDVQAMWCNARDIAVGFYAKLGWQETGERFEVEGVGRHIRMVRPIHQATGGGG